MDLTGHERHWLAQIEEELILDAPGMERAFRRWSTGPLRATKVRSAVRAVVAGTSTGVALPIIVLGLGVALLVLGLVDGWLAVALAGVVTTQVGPWLVARRVRSRHAGVPSRPRAPR